jgi:hypothetical protein
MVESRKDGWHLSGLLDPIGSKFSDVEYELAYMIHVWLFDGQSPTSTSQRRQQRRSS